MAKNLKVGETYTDKNGDVWDSAVLHVDFTKIDWKSQNMEMAVYVYKDSAARTAGYEALVSKFSISKSEFLANFNQTLSIGTLKPQSEDYALTLIDKHTGEVYGNKFE